MKQSDRSATEKTKKVRVQSGSDGRTVRILGGVPKPGRLVGEKVRIWGDDKDVQRLRVRLYG